ncbi:MAG: UDP-N-acetylmuramoyl-L-alanine--D-glutamate ligase [Bacteroidota bacterium]
MKKMVILGAGESGTGAALLAQAEGFEVFVSDAGTIAPHYKAELIARRIAFEEGKHSPAMILSADEVVKSPGIPDHVPIVQALRKASIPIIDEIELASRYTQAFLIGITGTNGKTTTTNLTYHLLKTAGLNVGLAGNVGKSFAKSVLEEKYDYYVLELSNFQLEGMYAFKADIACLLNITPDHLDRYHGQMAPYIQAKFRILQNMTPKDHFIYNQDDPNMQAYLQQHTAIPRQHSLSTKQPSEAVRAQLALLANTQFPLQGPHNQFNALVAITVAQLLEIDTTTIQRGLATFTGVPHRMEWVAEMEGVHFYNDSKATNVEAAEVALKSFNQPIIWIAGGQDKGNDYTQLQSLVHKHVKALICLGKDNTKITQAFQQVVSPIYTTQQVEEAVSMALACAQPGDVVLLSPACASFDLFKNFEERGEQFKQAVLEDDYHSK